MQPRTDFAAKEHSLRSGVHYGLEKAEYRNWTDAERYIAFIRISKAQIDNLGDFSSLTDNPLKSLDEYNYCRFTKKVAFD